MNLRTNRNAKSSSIGRNLSNAHFDERNYCFENALDPRNEIWATKGVARLD